MPAIAPGEQQLDLVDVLCAQRVPRLDVIRQRPGDVQCAVRWRGLGTRALARVIVDSDRTAREVTLVLGQLDAAESVPGAFGGLENDAAVGQRRYTLHNVLFRRQPRI